MLRISAYVRFRPGQRSARLDLCRSPADNPSRVGKRELSVRDPSLPARRGRILPPHHAQAACKDSRTRSPSLDHPMASPIASGSLLPRTRCLVPCSRSAPAQRGRHAGRNRRGARPRHPPPRRRSSPLSMRRADERAVDVDRARVAVGNVAVMNSVTPGSQHLEWAAVARTREGSVQRGEVVI